MAFADLLTLQKFAEAFANDNSLLTVLIARAVSEGMTRPIELGRKNGLWTDDDYAAFQAWFGRIDYPAAFNRGLRAERVATATAIVSDPQILRFLGLKPGSFGTELLALLGSGWLYQAALKQDDFFAIQLAAGFDRKPARFFPKQIELFRKTRAADAKSWNPSTRIAAMVTSNLGSLMNEFATEYASHLGAAPVAYALERHRLDTGRYPAALAELTPRYLASLPADLFSGKPYVYRLRQNRQAVLLSSPHFEG